MRTRTFTTFLLTFCLLLLPITALAKKGDKNFRRGMDYEAAQRWDKAAQEYTLAVAADPSNMEYQMHFRRASFNASQTFMQQGRALAEQRDFVGAYNVFRQAYGYDPVNELAVSEMERMLYLQNVKEGKPTNTNGSRGGEQQETSLTPISTQQQDLTAPHTEQVRLIQYNGDLKSFIRSLADQLNLNVIFDRQSFAQARNLDINLKDVTTAQALDYIFLQESLFFQKLSRRTILVADQARRPQYQQLVLRTFYLSNMKPTDARTLVQQAIPPSVGRPQTIVVPDDATNSLTVRDTAENVRLIGDLLQSIDKDRAEVVMDVNIYEVTKTDLLQFGNQLGDDTSLVNLGGVRSMGTTFGGLVRAVTPGATAAVIPGAFGAALVLPASGLQMLQTKNRTKLIASTQVHAFNGEESQARIGQRVPVQTAQAYPFGVQTGTTTTNNGFPSGGFPVINYEPTGLTLKFTPQVFPNLDVQVKMSIESKDVLGASTLTPTFTERTISGTARIQNNRTMMLASVATEIESNGRKGLPVLGLIPVLGRLFTAPTRDNRQVDIVIAVTPRVLRAPAVTPRDEEMRPSGTLQSPTTGSLEAMIREADHDDQMAAARRLPRSPVVQLPDAPLEVAANSTNAAPQAKTQTPAPVVQAGSGPGTAPATVTAQTTTPVVQARSGPGTAPATVATQNTAPVVQAGSGPGTPPATVAALPATTTAAQNIQSQSTPEELPSFVPAPKSLVSDRSAAEVAAVNAGTSGTQNAALTSLPKALETSLIVKSGSSRVARISFVPADDVLKVGEKRRFAVQLSSATPVSLVMLALRFDPKVVKVNAVTPGDLLASLPDAAPSITQSLDPGVCLISISALNGKSAMKGSGALVFIDVEAIGAGDAAFVFDKDSLHLVAIDARDIALEVAQGRAIVKQ
jgi:general secretion pathway protein D